MPAWIVRIALRLVPTEKLAKWILGITIGVLAFFLLLFIAPFIVFTHIPLGKNSDHFQYYSKAVTTIESETSTDYQSGIKLDWQELMAIDAVLLEQNFDLSSESRALDIGWRFIEEDTEWIEDTCEVEERDDDGNIITDDDGNPVWEEEDCSYEVAVYYEKHFNDVLQDLVDEELINLDQIEDIERYTTFNLEQLLSSQTPQNWEPREGRYLWPVPNVFRITSAFGMRSDPIQGGIFYHDGIDIGVPIGESVVAIQSGIVIFAGDRGTAGNAILIQHASNTESRYYHLNDILVMLGEVVEAGQIIGRSGNTGRSTGPHLHFEIHKNGVPTDPLPYY